MGNNSGKLSCMVSINASHDTQLNMFLISVKKAALVGNCGGVSSCGWVVFFSLESCMVLMMKTIPPSTPTAKLYGSSLCEKSHYGVLGDIGCNDTSEG